MAFFNIHQTQEVVVPRGEVFTTSATGQTNIATNITFFNIKMLKDSIVQYDMAYTGREDRGSLILYVDDVAVVTNNGVGEIEVPANSVIKMMYTANADTHSYDFTVTASI